MPVIPIGHCQCNIRFTGLAVPTGAELTLGINQSLQTPAQVATAVGGFFSNNLLSPLANEVTLSSVLCKFGPNNTGPSAEVAFQVAGSASGAAGPPNFSLLVKKVTGDGGRAGRGRWFIPGLPEGQVDEGGFILQATLDDYQDRLDAFLNDLIGQDLPPVVLHGAGSPLVSPSEITSLEVQPLGATQRRRMRR